MRPLFRFALPLALCLSPVVASALDLQPGEDVLEVGTGSGFSTACLAALAREVVSLEIDPARVAAVADDRDPPRVDFRVGGFELAGLEPVLVRAFNVLRQYDEDSAARAGHRSVVLNTGQQQPEAIALYERLGYRAVPGYGVYACAPDAVFLGRDLEPRDEGTSGREGSSWGS